MSDHVSAGDWKSTAMIRAENQLDDAADRAEKDLERLARLRAKQDAEQRERDAEYLAGLREFATAPGAPAEWRQVLADIDDGRYSWQDIAEHGADADPSVAAALAASAPPATPPQPAETDEFDEDDFSQNTYERSLKEL